MTDGVNRRRRWIFAIVALTIGIGAAEGLLQVAYRLGRGCWLAQANAEHASSPLVQFHPFLAIAPRPNARVSGLDGVTLSILPDGTRSMGTVEDLKNPSATTVVCIGGSSTFGYGVADEHSWPARLQVRLADRARIVNMGCYGHSTVEAIIQTALLVPERAPAVCVYYQGWNDAHVMHVKDLDAAYAEFHGKTQVLGIVGKRQRVRAQSPSMLLFSLNEIVQRISGAPDPWSDFRPPASQSEGTVDEVDPRALALYRRNLHTLVALCRAQGIVPVFVPQVLNYTKLSGDGVYGWAPRVRDGFWRAAMAEYNRTMGEVCRETDVLFVPEVLDRKWSAADFLDEGHLTQSGNEAFAEILAPALRNAIASATSGDRTAR